MANNRIQVKRTSVSGRTANVTSSGNSQYIAAGELALNMPDGILYTSNGSSLIEVGANNTKLNISTNNLTVGNTLYVVANGNVGIGTSTPLTKLVISNGSGEAFEFSPGNTLLNGGVLEYINRTTGTTRPDFNYYLGLDGSHKFYTGGAERMRVAANGNIGIGTSSPAQKLVVSGDAYFTGGVDGQGPYILRDGVSGGGVYTAQSGRVILAAPGNNQILFRVNSSEVARIDESGNLGVGITTPTEKLDVVGNIKASETVFANTLNVDNVLEINTQKNQVTTNTQIVASSFSMLTYRGAKFIVIGKTGNNTHISEVLLTHNSSNTFYNEYGVVYSGDSLYTISSDISANNVRLLLTPTNSNFSYEIIEQKFIENY